MSRTGRPPKVTAASLADMKQQYRQGVPVVAIAKQHHLSRNTLYRYLSPSDHSPNHLAKLYAEQQVLSSKLAKINQLIHLNEYQENQYLIAQLFHLLSNLQLKAELRMQNIPLRSLID